MEKHDTYIKTSFSLCAAGNLRRPVYVENGSSMVSRERESRADSSWTPVATRKTLVLVR